MATKKKKASGSRVGTARKAAVAAKKKPAVAAKKKPAVVAKKKPAVAAKKKPAVAAKKKPAVAAKKKPAVAAKKKPAVAAKKAVASQSARPKVRAATKRPVSTPPAAKAPPVHRRDATGHLDAGYAAMLREKSQEGRVRDSDEAFIGRAGHSKDNLAEAMGENWVQTATSGEDESEGAFNQSVPEDEGGPFVTTTAGQEFAEGTDASNPATSKREPFPRT